MPPLCLGGLSYLIGDADDLDEVDDDQSDDEDYGDFSHSGDSIG